jgi:hypothetical protein
MSVEPLLATTAQRAFIATITLQAIVVLAMIITTFSFVNDYVDLRDSRYKTLPCYLALFGLAEVFELFIAFDALRLRNIVQLIGLLIFHAALIIGAALQVYETKIALMTLDDCDGTFDFVNCGGPGTLWQKVKPFLIVAPCVISISWVLMLFFIRKLYDEFGWAIFNVVGANPKMKTMYRYYQIMLCFLKFDFFFVTGVTMQLLIIVIQTNSAEFGITIAAIPIVLGLLILCGLAVQREIKSVMTVSLILMLSALSYFIYKLVRFYSPDSRDQYITTRATLTAFTSIALILLLASFAVGIRCFADFDRGLLYSKTKDVAVRHGRNVTPNTSEKQDSGMPLGRRVSIE